MVESSMSVLHFISKQGIQFGTICHKLFSLLQCSKIVCPCLLLFLYIYICTDIEIHTDTYKGTCMLELICRTQKSL